MGGRAAPTGKEIAATAVLSLPLAEASVKVRTGMPADEPEDHDLDVWAGVLPISVAFGDPLPDPQLRAEIRSRPISATAPASHGQAAGVSTM